MDVHHAAQRAILAPFFLAAAINSLWADGAFAQEATVPVKIRAQPLAQALQQLAAESGMRLEVDSRLLQGKQSAPVDPSLPAQEAFNQLLTGSGLQAVVQNNTVQITRRQNTEPDGPVFDTADQRLADVIVTASSSPVSRYVGTSSQAAARLPADPMDLPVAGVSIPRALIEDQGVIRAAEAVRNVSGVTRNPAYLGLTDTYRVRGFAADVGLWNGFRRDFYYSFTDTAHLERIEVIKGAASVTYGDLEPGGIINYVTKRPTRNPVRSVQLTTGSYGLVRPEFDLGYAIGEDRNVRMRLTGAYEKADSFRNHVDSRLGTLGGTLDWDIVPGTRLELSGYWFDSKVVPDRGFFNAIGPVVLQLPRERFLGEPADRYELRQTDLAALISHRLSPAWVFRGGVNRYEVDDLRDNVQFRNMLPDGRTQRRQYTYVPGSYEYTTLFGEMRGDLSLGGMKHTLVAGVERIERDFSYDFRRDRSSSYAIDIFEPIYGQYSRPLAPQDRFSTDTRSSSVYVQDLIAIGDRIRLLAGLRHTRFKQSDAALDQGSQTDFSRSENTPRIGLLYRLTQQDSVFASYGRSFLPQTFAYTSLPPGRKATPEQGRQIEIGYKHTALDERLVAGVTAFEIKKSNVATTDPADPDLVILTGEQTVRGIEFDASARFGKNWSAIASFAWLDAYVSEDNTLPVGDRLVNTPRRQASLWLRHDFAALAGVGMGVGAYFVDSREAELPNTWTIPSYTRFDASAYWKVNPKVDVALHVKNLADKTYYDSQSNLLYPGAPRSAFVSVKYKF